MADPRAAQEAAHLAAILRPWGILWGLPGFEQHLTLRFSPRLTRSLGRCNPATGTLTLRRDLPEDRIPYVLCHEAAHIAVFQQFGTAARPHGPEWAALVTQAGFTPAVHAPSPEAPAPSLPPVQSTFRYAHRCLTCQTTRWARRPIRQWRCAECVAAGLPGEMQILDTCSSQGRP